MLFNSGKSGLTEEMQILEICKYMCWDYIQYLSQPKWLLDLVLIRMSEEAKASERQQRKQEAKSRRKTV